MNKPLIIFCPNPYSLYTNSVCELLIRKGYSIEAIVVKQFSITRFRNEFRRDGKRLLRKIWKKLILRGNAYAPDSENINAFRKKNNLKIKDVKAFKENGVKIIYCKSLNDQIVESTLKNYKDKLVVFTGGGIIRKNILDHAGSGILNCHMGILPKYKGMDLPEWCILENSMDQIGITLHFMDSGIDTGDILKSIKIPIADSENIKSLREKMEPVMAQEMVNTVDEFLKGKINPTLQTSAQNRQYFIVHKKLYELVNKKIQKRKSIV